MKLLPESWLRNQFWLSGSSYVSQQFGIKGNYVQKGAQGPRRHCPQCYDSAVM
jgi:hypothetical protein